MVAIRIEPARHTDTPAIVQLVNSAYRGDSSRQGWTTEADLLEGIRTDEAGIDQLISDQRATLLKAVTPEGLLVGTVLLEEQDKALYLGMLTVAPSLQNAGIGKHLLKAGEDFATEKGYRKIVMTVITDRTELIGWYQRKGYQPTGVRKPFPDDPRFGIPKKPLEFMVLEKRLP